MGKFSLHERTAKRLHHPTIDIRRVVRIALHRERKKSQKRSKIAWYGKSETARSLVEGTPRELLEIGNIDESAANERARFVILSYEQECEVNWKSPAKG